MADHLNEIAARDAEIFRLRAALLDIAEGEEEWTRSGLASIARYALCEPSIPPEVNEDLLTNETVRQHLGEQIPGLPQLLAESLGYSPADFFRHLEAGSVTKTAAIAALAALAIKLKHELVLAGEDQIDRTGTVEELVAYRAAHGLPDE